MNDPRFKFRAWHKEKQKMFRSVGFTDSDVGRTIVREAYMIDDGTDMYMGGRQVALMQSTGLKDKNGKLIYEGDIMRYKNPNHPGRKQFLHKVEWNQAKVRYSMRAIGGPIHSGATFTHQEERWEIIGNIYENPELLT